MTNEILKFINKNVMITQNDIQEYIEKISSLKVHQSTISRFLKFNNISKKIVTKKYSEKKDITE